MSLLVTMPADDSARELRRTHDAAEIAVALAEDGIRFERWPVKELPFAADGPAVLAAYAEEVERLCASARFPVVDVVRVKRDPADGAWPDKARAMREKFLEEHTHDEDEVRFFAEGAGAFYLRAGERVHVVVCTAGDLIGVPHRMRHWFDMGEDPTFSAVRFFGTKDGWVGAFTGDPIARAFPSFDAIVREEAAR